MRRLNVGMIGVLLAAILLAWGPAMAMETAVSKTVTVNTNATDFEVVATATGQTIRVTHIDAQNIGTTNKITLLLCDGTCATAANVKYRWQLSPATASAHGGGWTFAPCAGKSCYWEITPGNTLYAQVDTGATNNVYVAVTYYLFSQP